MYTILETYNGNNKNKNLDTKDSIMLTYPWIELIDVPLFILYIFLCTQTSSMEVFSPKESSSWAVCWCVSCRIVFYTHLAQGLDPLGLKTSQLDTCVQRNTYNINTGTSINSM
jgi:hypothetical protein